MPWQDPQFWAVTLAAFFAVAQIVRPFFKKAESPCESCAIAEAVRRQHETPGPGRPSV